MNPEPPAIPSLLEQQQLNVVDPAAHTFWHWVRFDLVKQAADRVGATSVLDIGAGSGMLGDWMAQHDPTRRYRFEELSPILDAALAAHFGDAARSDPTTPIEPVTLVALLDVIEHIEDDVAAMSSLADRMAPGTTIVVTAPALQWAFSSWDTELGHFRRYSRRGLRELLHGVGFAVETSQYLFPEMLVMLPLRKIRPGTRTDVDFPELSDRMNRLGHAVSSTTAKARRIWPAGTSVVAVATKPGARPSMAAE